MRIIAIKTLRSHWQKRPESEVPLREWFSNAAKANWRSPADVKSQYRSASLLRDGRCVFNIGGNKYRLVVWINYDYQTIYIRFVGTHAEYDSIDAPSV